MASQARNQVAAVILHADFVGDDQYGQEADARGEHEAVNEDDEGGALEIPHLGRFHFAVNLSQRFLAAHRQDRMAERQEQAEKSRGTPVCSPSAR